MDFARFHWATGVTPALPICRTLSPLTLFSRRIIPSLSRVFLHETPQMAYGRC
jgi:hypothetical protein